MRKKVLFICTHNSARSQMAEGLLNAHFGDRFQALSAGTHPTGLHPLAVQAMAEIGIDISSHRSKHIAELRDEEFDYVVTVCDRARETCPFFPRARVLLNAPFPDPSSYSAETELDAFRTVRDMIAAWIEETFGTL